MGKWYVSYITGLKKIFTKRFCEATANCFSTIDQGNLPTRDSRESAVLNFMLTNDPDTVWDMMFEVDIGLLPVAYKISL